MLSYGDVSVQYAHAVAGGSHGTKDLERSRKALLREGFVYKENFLRSPHGDVDEARAMSTFMCNHTLVGCLTSQEGESKYNEERLRNPARAAVRDGAAERASRDAAAFSSWTAGTNVNSVHHDV
jgi:hypothetical protein